MPKPKKPKEIKLFKNEKAVEDFFDILFGVGKKIYDKINENMKETSKPQEQKRSPTPSPRPQEAENKVAPPLPTFVQDVKSNHERLLEQKKVAKQFLKRLG